MNLDEYKGVYVFAQQVDNVINSIAFELIGKGKDLAEALGTEVTAVLVGSNVESLADELAEYGADRVIVVDDPELKEYRTEPYAHALASVVNQYKPEILLVGATAIGRDLGPRVSARVHTGLTADCTQLEIGDFPINPLPGKEQKHNQLLMTRPAFGGNTIATIACPDFRPQMATVRPGVMQKREKKAGVKANVEKFNPGFTPTASMLRSLRLLRQLPIRWISWMRKFSFPAAAVLAAPRISSFWRSLQRCSAARSAARAQWLTRAGNQGAPGGSDRKNGSSACVFRGRHFRSHPAHCRYGGGRYHCCHQQG